MNYYNEFDPNAAAWLRELIARKLIPDGVVDERSITEIKPDELTEYTQCHFFAGIGGWSLALELAGTSSDVRLWTGSCPCQPFSLAGKGKGTDDERHLWPAFFALIRECRPERVFGEQVASAIGHGWLDGVFADLESSGYACGAAVLAAAGVGAPHIRQRLYWVAKSESEGGRGLQPVEAGPHDESGGSGQGELIWMADRWAETFGWKRVSFASDCLGGDDETGEPGDICSVCGLDYCDGCQCPGPTQDGYEYEERDGILYGRLADRQREGLEGHAGNGDHGDQPGRVGTEPAGHAAESRGAGGVGKPDRSGFQTRDAIGSATEEGPECAVQSGVSDFWSSAVWHLCRDGKHRRIPTQSALFPLADGLPYKLARRGSVRPALLKGAGNAIVPAVAAEFIRAFFSTKHEFPH